MFTPPQDYLVIPTYYIIFLGFSWHSCSNFSYFLSGSFLWLTGFLDFRYCSLGFFWSLGRFRFFRRRTFFKFLRLCGSFTQFVTVRSLARLFGLFEMFCLQAFLESSFDVMLRLFRIQTKVFHQVLHN